MSASCIFRSIATVLVVLFCFDFGDVNMNKNVIFGINNYLKSIGVVEFENESNAVMDRVRGKKFSFEDHIRALIYSLLTNQRRWSDVEPKLPQIDKLFFYYKKDEILSHSAEYFESGVRRLSCGNRSIKQQMQGLHYDISVFERIECKYGSLDAYVTSKEAHEIVKDISSGQYKLKGIGVALAWEYLRNVGIDGAKPDLHLKRFFGSERMGVSSSPNASDEEVLKEIARLSIETGLTKFEIDYLIWCFCADGKGEICTINPKCKKCIVSQYCNKGHRSFYEEVNFKEEYEDEHIKYREVSDTDKIIPDIKPKRNGKSRKQKRLEKENMYVPNGRVYIGWRIALVNNQFDLGGECTRLGVQLLRFFIMLSACFLLLSSIILILIIVPAGLIFLVSSIVLFIYAKKLKIGLQMQERTKGMYH